MRKPTPPPPAPPPVVVPNVEPIPQPPEPPPPTKRLPTFIQVPLVKQRVQEDSLYADIINHSSNPVLGHDRATNAHETTHGINADIRNAHSRDKKRNGYYVREGRGVVIDEPKCRKNDIKEFLPESLHSYRYSLYIAGQQAWDDQPTYILDEAVAYWNDAMTSVEDVQKGRHKGGNSDGVSGLVDFGIYSIALAMAVEKHDPEYWNNNQQFRDFLLWYLQSAEETYKIGATMKEFNWFEEQRRLLQSLQTSAEAAPMREFIKKNLDGVWLNVQ